MRDREEGTKAGGSMERIGPEESYDLGKVDYSARARCRICGYLLRGLPEARCPECGTAFDPGDPRTMDVEAFRPRAGDLWLGMYPRSRTRRRRRIDVVRVIAVCGVCVALGALLWNLSLLRGQGPRREIDVFYRAFAAVGVVLDLALLTGSVGAMGYRRWARPMLMGWAGVALGVALIRLALALLWLAPRATEAARGALAGRPPSEFGSEFEGMMVSLVAAGTWVMSSILPVCVLIVMRRPAVRGAFAGIPLAQRAAEI